MLWVCSLVSAVMIVALSPDGRAFTSDSVDEIGRLRAAAGEQFRYVLQEDMPDVPGRVQTLASDGIDEIVELWDVTSAQVRHTLQGDMSSVRGGSFSPGQRTSIFSSMPRPIHVDQSLSGRLDRSGEEDTYGVTLVAGTRYHIEVSLDSLDDSVLTLFSPSGNQVASNDDLGDSSYASRINYTAPRSGTYRIRVEGYGSSTGSYQLSVSERIATVQAQELSGNNIGVDTTLFGRVSRVGEEDRYEVRLQAGTRYRFEVLLDSLDDSVLTLFSPSGNQVASNDDLGDSSYASRINYTAPRSGIYKIGVGGYESSTGSYRLLVSRRGAGADNSHASVAAASMLARFSTDDAWEGERRATAVEEIIAQHASGNVDSERVLDLLHTVSPELSINERRRAAAELSRLSEDDNWSTADAASAAEHLAELVTGDEINSQERIAAAQQMTARYQSGDLDTGEALNLMNTIAPGLSISERRQAATALANLAADDDWDHEDGMAAASEVFRLVTGAPLNAEQRTAAAVDLAGEAIRVLDTEDNFDDRDIDTATEIVKEVLTGDWNAESILSILDSDN